ncbi:MAG: ATP-grasp domain-containing protein [Candidatus Dormibacteria bacterium]
MILLEHQAKQLLREIGIAVPDGAIATTPAEAAAIASRLGGEVMLKAQVPRSDRATHGGVRSATSPREASRVARSMLGSSLLGARIDSVLVEERISGRGELYLGAVYDPIRRRPVLVASAAGGTGVENTAERVVREFQVGVGCRAHATRELGRDLGLHGRDLLSFAHVASTLARAFLEQEALLWEMNPLLVTDSGMVALDAHLDIDDNAPPRSLGDPEQPGTGSTGQRQTETERLAAEIDASDHRGVAGRLVEFGGPLALLLGGGGASLTAFDAVLARGLEPFNYCEIGGNPTAAKIQRLTSLLLGRPQVTHLAVMMNVVNNTRADIIAEGVIAGVLSSGRDPAETIITFRVPGHDEARCRQILADHGVEYLDASTSLEATVDRLAAAASKAAG